MIGELKVKLEKFEWKNNRKQVPSMNGTGTGLHRRVERRVNYFFQVQEVYSCFSRLDFK